MKEILWYALVFIGGICLGFLIKVWFVVKFQNYDGTMYVNRDKLTERTVYSLELDEYPEKLEFKKLVIFKVDTSKEGLKEDPDRE